MNRKYATRSLTLGIVLVIGIVLLFSLGSREKEAVIPLADWTDHYMCGEDLVEAADLVIEGEVIAKSCEQRLDLVFTKQSIEIQKQYKGNLNTGSQIQLLQTGGELNGIKTEAFPEAPLLENNQNYLLFLKNTEEGHYLIMGGYQGAAKIENNRVSFPVKNDEIAQELDQKTLDEIAQELLDQNG